jgi:TMEM175 potassium channel family protein
MSTNRLEAFSDGVLAIIITIMVLELRAPEGADLGALQPLLPMLGSYVLSFVILGIYWNNHHHLLHATKSVNGNIMWANLFLLFCLSLLPFTTAWLGTHPGALWPTVFYGASLLLPGFAFRLLVSSIIGLHGRDSAIAKAIGSDFKGYASLFLYVTAIALAFFNPWISYGIFALVAMVWFIPDRRVEGIRGE